MLSIKLEGISSIVTENETIWGINWLYSDKASNKLKIENFKHWVNKDFIGVFCGNSQEFFFGNRWIIDSFYSKLNIACAVLDIDCFEPSI